MLPSYVYNMYQDTKSTRLIAVCKRSLSMVNEDVKDSQMLLGSIRESKTKTKLDGASTVSDEPK